MNDTELKTCPFCGETPVLKAVGRDWFRLATTCTSDCMLLGREFDYSLSEGNRQLLIDDWNRRTPQDNWIPIKNQDKLKIGYQYIIQTVDGNIIQTVFSESRDCFICPSTFDYLYDVNDVEYYQPLPEPRK